MEIFDTITAKDKRYEIRNIIKTFLASSNGNVNSFCVNRDGKKGVSPAKLCYEIDTQRNGYSELRGLTFNVNTSTPYYVSYHGMIIDNVIVIRSGNIMRNLLENSPKQKCIVPDIQADDHLRFVNGMKESKVLDKISQVGSIVTRNMSTSILVDNMKIQIPNSDILSALSSLHFMSGEKSLFDYYGAISQAIANKRLTGRDLNWFMYKIMLIEKIIN